MDFSLTIDRAQLKVLSAVSANFVVIWIAAIFTTRDVFSLLLAILFAIVSWKTAVNVEKLLEG